MGITSSRFTVPREVFDDKNEDNTCYCRFYDEDPNLCFSSGILDMRPCQFGEFSNFIQSEMIEKEMHKKAKHLHFRKRRSERKYRTEPRRDLQVRQRQRH